jgi:hypothetical protein
MIPYNWTREEESIVNLMLQLMAVMNIKLFLTPTTPNDIQLVGLKSAFSKMSFQCLKEEENKIIHTF